ncbi:MAG: hypothetical protein AAB403_15270, partial [Planctomycetota bacterium]
MYLDGGLPSRGASQPNQQYRYSPGHSSIDFFAVFLLEKYPPAARPSNGGPTAPKAPGLTECLRAQKEIDKTADDGASTGCCTYEYPSLSTSRTAFFSHVASCL